MSSGALKNQGASSITVVKKMRDYSDEPFVKKKAEKAIATIKKYGLPKTSRKKNK